MSEEVDDTAAFLHAFEPDTARALKKADIFAADLRIVVKVYGEAQRLQGIVAKLTREEEALKASLAAKCAQGLIVERTLETISGQLANNERLLDEARKGAEARIAVDLDTWRNQQLTARRQELDESMATGQREYQAVTAALEIVQTEVKATEAEHTRLQAANDVLRQTRLDLVGDIATAV